MTHRSVVIALMCMIAVLAVGCIRLVDLPSRGASVIEFTARDALDVLGMPSMAKATALGAIPAGVRSSLMPDIVEAMDLIRASDALSHGATAQGVTVFVIDDFSVFKFEDGRYHGQYVAAIIKIVAPQATVLTCDAWKEDLGGCLLEAMRMSERKEIQVVNMSLGLVGTSCVFFPPTNTHGDDVLLESPFGPDQTEPFEPEITLSRDQVEVLEGWVRDIRANGVVVVSSAGNDGYRNAAKAPGCWSTLAAGAVYDASFERVDWTKCVDENVKADDRTCWSNYGTIFAPGAIINNVFEDGIKFNGTSASAPFTSGVAALVIGTRKIYGEDVGDRIMATAVSIPDRFQTGLKHIRLDAVNATGASVPQPETLEKFLDKNKNCVLDDDEILLALTLWISQKEWSPGKRISDADIITLLHKWIKQMNIC